jgi:hypothetical protein
MQTSRRTFIGWAVSAAILTAALRGLGDQSLPPPKNPPPPRGFPRDTRQDAPPIPPPDPNVILKANQKTIKRDVQKLLELAEELKKEVDKTDSAEFLNLSLVHKAEEIEKLARQIRTMAKG